MLFTVNVLPALPSASPKVMLLTPLSSAVATTPCAATEPPAPPVACASTVLALSVPMLMLLSCPLSLAFASVSVITTFVAPVLSASAVITPTETAPIVIPNVFALVTPWSAAKMFILLPVNSAPLILILLLPVVLTMPTAAFAPITPALP